MTPARIKFLIALGSAIKNGAVKTIKQAMAFAEQQFGKIDKSFSDDIINVFKKEGKTKPGEVVPIKKKEGIETLNLPETSDTDMLRKSIEQLESLKAPGTSLDPVTGLTRTLARRILDRKKIQIDKNDPLDVFNDIFGESIIDVKDLAEEMLEIDRRGGGIKNIDQMLEADGLFDIKIPQNPNRGIPNDELLEILKKDLNEKELITTKVPQKSEYQKTIESISALDNDINRRVMKKELKREFPGITDTMIEDILTDADPQRIAEVKQTMREALEMQSKGMSFDEIVDIFKKTTRRKQATGGRVQMAKGGLPNILGF
tara:strand:- start:1611 stop:2558 length:948 start_codon:yes stop_codon:yes gene_type:complete